METSLADELKPRALCANPPAPDQVQEVAGSELKVPGAGTAISSFRHVSRREQISLSLLSIGTSWNRHVDTQVPGFNPDVPIVCRNRGVRFAVLIETAEPLSTLTRKNRRTAAT